uniref:Mitochondrial ribosomal protein S5 n=1 Tax=Pavo cristatus TaxID=9049 RepID=A0A8C9FJE8_PAVCR
MAAAVVAAAGRACAYGVVRAAWRGFASVPVKGGCCSYSSLAWSLQVRCSISVPQNVTVQQCRQSSFFNTSTAEQLWKGALAETGVGVKKGRGKRRKKKLKKNLNRGQEIGEGRSGFLWPGLNAPLIQSGRVQALTQRKKEERDKIQSEIIQQRDTWEKKRKIKIKREGGWSGKCWGGVLLDPPDPGPNGGKRTELISSLVLLAFLSRGWVKGRSRLFLWFENPVCASVLDAFCVCTHAEMLIKTAESENKLHLLRQNLLNLCC